MEPLTTAEQRISDAVQSGRPVSFGAEHEDAIRDGATWGSDRTVSAPFLGTVIRDAPPGQLVALAGLRVRGLLNLFGCSISVPLFLDACWFDSDIELAGATLPSLSLKGSRIPALRASRLKAVGEVDLAGSLTGGIDIRASKIGATCSFDGVIIDSTAVATAAQPKNSTPSLRRRESGLRGCLRAEHAEIEGSLSAIRLTITSGFLELTMSKVRGPVILDGASITAADHESTARSISANGAQLGGIRATPHQGVRFVARGTISMKDSVLTGPLRMSGADLKALRADDDALDMSRATVPAVNLHAGMARFTADGTIRLIGAKIAGQLDLNGAKLSTSNGGVCLHGDRAVIGSVQCSTHDPYPFVSNGAIRFVGATVSWQFNLIDATVTSSDPNGTLTLANATIKNDLLLAGASIISSATTKAISLAADRANIGAIFAHSSGPERPFTAIGTVRLAAARVDRELGLQSARLSAGAGTSTALHADRAHLASVYCQPFKSAAGDHGPFCATGTVRFVGAEIGGQLNLTAGRVTSDDPDGALLLARAVVRHTIYLDGAQLRGTATNSAVAVNGEGLRAAKISCRRGPGHAPFTTSGSVLFPSATVEGNLDLTDSSITAASHRPALSVTNATIANRLVLDGATISAGTAPRAIAIDADDATVASVGLNRTEAGPFASAGGCRWVGAEIKGRFSARGAAWADSETGEPALTLDGASIDELVWAERNVVWGQISLIGTRVRQLTTDGPDGFPARIALDGLTYGRWTRHPSDPAPDPTRWHRWGGSLPSWQLQIVSRNLPVRGSRPTRRSLQATRSLQPFEQLASVLRTQGDDAGARSAFFERERQAARQDHNRLRRLLNWAYRLTTGYGFRAYRAVIVLLMLWLTSLSIVSLASSGDYLTPRITSAQRPNSGGCIAILANDVACPAMVVERASDSVPPPLSTMQTAVYAAERVVPAVDLGERSRFTVRGWPAGALAIVTFLGWVLTIALVAALTKTLRRD